MVRRNSPQEEDKKADAHTRPASDMNLVSNSNSLDETTDTANIPPTLSQMQEKTGLKTPWYTGAGAYCPVTHRNISRVYEHRDHGSKATRETWIDTRCRRYDSSLL